jgi:hypothetical protein
MKTADYLLFSIVYLLVLMVNLIPSIKYPDGNLNIWNLIFTILFILILFYFSRKVAKAINLFLIGGAVGGTLIYIVNFIDEIALNSLITDLIVNIQYPFFIIFVTPFFGVNSLFQFNVSLFSLLSSFFYIIVLLFTVILKKSHPQNI